VLAGVQAGVFADLSHAAQNWSLERDFQPAMNEATRQHLLAGWEKAVKAVIS
jgi:glycerol kinase